MALEHPLPKGDHIVAAVLVQRRREDVGALFLTLRALAHDQLAHSLWPASAGFERSCFSLPPS